MEHLFFLGVGTTWYWIQKKQNAVDWDYDHWTDRFDREVLRFDNNRFGTNFLFHPLAGSIYVGLARANDLSLGWSYTYAFTTSLVWEWLIELKERVSINDQLVTPAGGLVLGEFFYRVSRLLHERASTRSRRAAAWTLGIGVRAHRALDGRRPPERSTLSGEFTLTYGVGALLAETSEPLHSVRFEGRIVDLSGYRRPGHRSVAARDANFVSLRGHATRGAGGGGIELHGDVVLAARYVETLSEGGRGGSVLVGSAMAYTYRRLTYRTYRDRLAWMHLPGLAVEAHVGSPRARLSVSTRAHLLFGAADAWPSFDVWALANPGAQPQSVLDLRSYSYQWGAGGSLEVALELGPVEVGLRAVFGSGRSTRDLDRHQETTDVDLDIRSRRTDAEAWAIYRLPGPLHVELRYEALFRKTTLAGSTDRRDIRRLTLSLGVRR